MNLAETMRPKTLDEVIGNEHIVTPLRKQLEDGTLSQSLMFTGIYGSGKTSFAKIIANELHADVTEIDCGSEGSVENIRQLVESATHSSLFSAKKVFILDEAHKLSQPAQSALLKTLEDSNNNVHFILVTNEPKKLMKTIQSRCVVYETRPATNAQVGEAVNRVKEKYGIEFESTKDFWPVIEQAEGSLRVVYSVLEKLIPAANEKGFISSETFQSIIGSYEAEQESNENFPRSLLKKDMQGALDALESAMENSNPVVTAMGAYRYLRTVYTKGKPNERQPHVQALLVDLTPLVHSRLVEWYDLEVLIWRHM